MTPKETSHVIQGMQKDTSKSKLSKEFAFDAKNIRITARENSTLLTITNERGTQKNNDIRGVYIGHCILQETLVLFTKYTNPETGEVLDYIVGIKPNIPLPNILYIGDLNLSIDHPIEALGVYENEEIQKVYWVDGINQPRVINIKKSYMEGNKFKDASSFDFIPELALQESISIEAVSNSSMFAPGVIQYAFSYYNKYGQESNIFDVTPLCYIAHKERGASPEEVIKDIAFKIRVDNVDTNFEYIRIYSIHRTSLNSTPTVKRIIDLPISIPEEYTDIVETGLAFDIGKINKIYVRKLGEEIPEGLITDFFGPPSIEEKKYGNITEEKSIFYFNKKLGYTYDLVVGSYNDGIFEVKKVITGNYECFNYIETVATVRGKTIYNYRIVSTSEDNPITIKYKKENSRIPSITYIDNGTLGETIDPTQLLYIGGEAIIASTITQKDNTLFLGNINLLNNSIPDKIKEYFRNNSNLVTADHKNVNINDYKYTAEETDRINYYSYFRAGEIYRLGVQFQYCNGKWSEPVYIGDITQSEFNRPEKLVNNTYILPIFTFNISSEIKEDLINLGIKRFKGLVVYPENTDRKIVAQGILCPTVFNTENRSKNNPYTQASWLLRPFVNKDFSSNTFTDNNAVSNVEKGAIVEFRHNQSIITGANRGSEIQNNTEYRIDQSILTFHSPEVEFDEGLHYGDTKLKIIGITLFDSNYGDIDIKTKSSTLSPNAGGFKKYQVVNNNSGSTGLISGTFYEDFYVSPRPSPVDPNDYEYGLIYMWHRSGSLNTDDATTAAEKDRTQYATLLTKKISNIKFASKNIWFNKSQVWKALGGLSDNKSYANGISKIEKFNSDQINLLKLKTSSEDTINYFGNIDTLLSTDNSYNIFYSDSYNGEFKSAKDGSFDVTSKDPVRMKYKSSPHLVFSLNKSNGNKHTIILPTLNKLNSFNDTIVEADTNLPDAKNIEYITYKFDYNLGNALPSYFKDGDIIVMPNLYNYTILEFYIYNGGRLSLYQPENEVWLYYIIPDSNLIEVYEPVAGNYNTRTWRYYTTINSNASEEEDNTTRIKQDSITFNYNIFYPDSYLYLAELYKEPNKNIIFGGNTEEAIKNNLWLPASQSIPIDRNETIIYEYGDTRYQRYDCLKTYAFTPEDENQVIEIASFMCETRVNMLGRYDKNIGNLSNLNADPTNFNLFNPVYSQRDNFFNYRILDSDIYKLDKFTNTITWSKEKFAGEDVDTWTNITMANTLDLDGTKGKVNKLITFKDQIFAFQDRGISNILFNSRVQIPVSDGVPIEITNGYKVDGYRYISDSVGCQNKNSIIATSSGVYFLDSESNGIYLLADGLTNLSTNKGFDIWTKEVSKDPSFKSFYDKNEKDIYFTTKDYCLGYSEKLGQFTSFYDYTDVETMFNVGTGFYSIKANSGGDQSIYQHSIGNYNEFYGETKPYYLTIISNDDPQVDKVFTNLDYRADFFDSNNNYLENESFDTLEVWNEYQSGKETLKYSKFRPSNLKKKFRMWGANIPRDKKNKLDRMRNPWLYIKLSKENPGTSKMELHDIVVKYFE
jgi:hypothetical protein